MKVRRISTQSLESALDQIIRVQTAGGRAVIKPVFVASLLKELIDRRYEEQEIFAEVEELFGDDELGPLTPDSDPLIQVDEVMSLDDLGTSSWTSGSDLDRVERPETEEDELLYDEPYVPVLKSKRRPSNGMHVRGRWSDGDTTRKLIIFTLLAVIALSFGSLLL